MLKDEERRKMGEGENQGVMRRKKATGEERMEPQDPTDRTSQTVA